MDDVRAFLDASEAFFKAFAAVAWGALLLAVAFQLLRLLMRVRAWQNILQAAYPDTKVRYWSTFGAYMAGVGVNAIVPARGGDVVKLYIARHRIEGASYPTLASSLVVETLFDFVVAAVLFLVAIQMGLLPGVPDLPRLPAFDWTFVVEHPRVAVFIWCILLGGLIVLIGWASRHVTAFRQKLVLGFAILHDWHVYVREVVSWQAGSWLARVGSRLLLPPRLPRRRDRRRRRSPCSSSAASRRCCRSRPAALGRSRRSSSSRSAGRAASSTILAFSFGQQLVTTILSVTIGFGAILLMLGTLRWRHHVSGDKDEMTGGQPPPDEGVDLPKSPHPVAADRDRI